MFRVSCACNVVTPITQLYPMDLCPHSCMYYYYYFYYNDDDDDNNEEEEEEEEEQKNYHLLGANP